MKHFLDSKNQLFAFESDGSQDFLITDDMRPATDDEVRAIQSPTPSMDQAREMALREIRAQRAPLLDALAGIGFDALVDGDMVTAQAVATARAALKDLPTLPAFIAADTYDDMRAAILARYKELAAAAPDTVQVAFAKLFE